MSDTSCLSHLPYFIKEVNKFTMVHLCSFTVLRAKFDALASCMSALRQRAHTSPVFVYIIEFKGNFESLTHFYGLSCL